MKTGYVDGSAEATDLELTPEVCIIGSGAGGAVAAYHLALRGKEVLVVEEGGHYTRADFKMRESIAYPMLYQEAGQRATADLGVLMFQGKAVGGTTVVNWTTCFRTPARVLDHWRTHHAVRNVDEKMLEPHWAAVEERLHINKVRPEEMNRNNRLLYDGCKAMGWQVDTTSRNVKGCRQSGYCGMGCPVDAKQSMLVTYLPDAVEKGVAVLSRCRIDRFVTNGGDVTEARGVLLTPDGLAPTGRTVTIRARKFILSAGAIGSPAILLRSGIDDDTVGRRTFLHPVVASVGLYKDPVLACYGAPQSAASHQFVDRGDKVGFLMEVAPLHPVLMAIATPGIGDSHRAAMELYPQVAPHIALMVDGFSDEETGGRVKLRPSGAPVLDYVIPERVQEAMMEAQQCMARIQFASGAVEVATAHDPAVRMKHPNDVARIREASFKPGEVLMMSAHIMGGCAMGDDPARAFVRSGDLKAHRFNNLHVVDGSVFPTSLGVNPQLSIYGLARLAANEMVV